jgi:TIR domain
MSYKIFISSSVKDIDLMRDLKRRLQSSGIEVRSWDKEIGPGQLISQQVIKNISNADEVVVILSNESVDNPNLMFELGAASSMKKRVTPVVVGLESSKVPSLIRNLKYIKYPEISRYIADLEKRAKVA